MMAMSSWPLDPLRFSVRVLDDANAERLGVLVQGAAPFGKGDILHRPRHDGGRHVLWLYQPWPSSTSLVGKKSRMDLNRLLFNYLDLHQVTPPCHFVHH